jgi:hypothetical protein
MKRALACCLMAATLGLASNVEAQSSYAQVVLADNPIAYYRFEETSGTEAADSSGNGNVGEYRNGPALAQAGAEQLGRAVRFDGIDDFVSTPRSVAGSFTLELWVNTTANSLGGGQAFEGNGLVWSDVGGGANDFTLAALNNRLAFFTGDTEVTVSSTSTINNGEWRHLVATRSLGGQVRVFVDGQEQASFPAGGAQLSANPIMAIGGNVLDGRYFNGLIDEVAYYDTALSPERIQAHYLAGIQPTLPTPVPRPAVVHTLSGSSLAVLALLVAAMGWAGLRRR